MVLGALPEICNALPYAVAQGGVLAARWLYVGILIFSSADPLHDGDGKRKYCDILGLLWGMIWKRKCSVFFVLCLCRKA